MTKSVISCILLVDIKEILFADHDHVPLSPAAQLCIFAGAAGYMELPALDPQELAADVAKESRAC